VVSGARERREAMLARGQSRMRAGALAAMKHAKAEFDAADDRFTAAERLGAAELLIISRSYLAMIARVF
jgi:hypothetical protein